MLSLEKTSLFDSVIIFLQIYKHFSSELVITMSNFVQKILEIFDMIAPL